MTVPLRAAFYDVGGTLLEAPEGQDLWHPIVMARINKEFGARPWEEPLYRWLGLRHAAGPHLLPLDDPHRQETNRWIADFLRERGEEFSEGNVERLRSALAAPLPPGFSLVPGAAEALRWCKSQGLTIEAVANTISRGDSEIAQDWPRLGLDNVVDFGVSSYSTGWTKPHPAIFRRALSLAGVSAEEAVMVGNHFGNDIVGAKQVGMRAVWKTSTRRQWSEGEEILDAVIASLVELPRVLEAWLQT